MVILLDAQLVTWTPIRTIFEPPTNAVLPAQGAAFKATAFLDVCSAVIWFGGKSQHSQVALVSAGRLVLSIVSDTVDTGNQL